MNAAAEKIIAELRLTPLPQEGGFFRQTWLSERRLGDGRAAGSAILFLITPENFSVLHRLETDELWHFCAGDPVEHVQLDPYAASTRFTRLGPDPIAHTVQLAVRGGTWQGARLAGHFLQGWALLACTMAPAWEEKEFTLGQREELARLFPTLAGVIATFTR